MNHLRRLQAEQPVLFWVLVALGLFLGFQLVLSVVGLLLGPFGLPSWVPIVVVVGGLVLIARASRGPGEHACLAPLLIRVSLTTCCVRVKPGEGARGQSTGTDRVGPTSPQPQHHMPAARSGMWAAEVSTPAPGLGRLRHARRPPDVGQGFQTVRTSTSTLVKAPSGPPRTVANCPELGPLVVTVVV